MYCKMDSSFVSRGHVYDAGTCGSDRSIDSGGNWIFFKIWTLGARH